MITYAPLAALAVAAAEASGDPINLTHMAVGDFGVREFTAANFAAITDAAFGPAVRGDRRLYTSVGFSRSQARRPTGFDVRNVAADVGKPFEIVESSGVEVMGGGAALNGQLVVTISSTPAYLIIRVG